jgi:hypothetical protein
LDSKCKFSASENLSLLLANLHLALYWPMKPENTCKKLFLKVFNDGNIIKICSINSCEHVLSRSFVNLLQQSKPLSFMFPGNELFWMIKWFSDFPPARIYYIYVFFFFFLLYRYLVSIVPVRYPLAIMYVIYIQFLCYIL